MRLKSIFSVPIFILTIFWIMNFLSCKDNPTVSTNKFELDSARFDIEAKLFERVDIWDVCVIDTNNIYLTNPYFLLYYDGINNNTYYFNDNFYCIRIGGLDNDNIYLGGRNVSGTQSPPRLKKWAGAGFIEIPIGDSLNDSFLIDDIFVKESNEVWITGGNKYAMKYDGNRIKKYYFPDTLYDDSYILLDDNNNTCLLRTYNTSNGQGTGYKIIMKFYKLINDEFVFYSYHEYNSEGVNSIYAPGNIGNKICAYAKDGIYEFDGYNYNKTVDAGDISLLMTAPRKFKKASINNVLLKGTIGNEVNSRIFHWNGNKWSLEKGYVYYIDCIVHYFFYVNNVFIGFGNNGIYSYLYFYKKKKLN